MATKHVSVFLEVLPELLQVKPGDCVIDATLGKGGHTEMLLTLVYPNGHVLAIDQDIQMISLFREHASCSKKKYWSGLILAHGNFSDIKALAKKYKIHSVNCVLYDLGISRWHYLESGRGFSFQNRGEPLDMRINPNAGGSTAADLLHTLSLNDLADIFYRFGEIRASWALARAVVKARRKRMLVTVNDLLIALEEVPSFRRVGKLHPATQVFQALRIAVNNELSVLETSLTHARALLVSGGKIAVISFHSLEDRIVKHMFRMWHTEKSGKVLSKKPILPSRHEIASNPSARSAKLRIFQSY